MPMTTMDILRRVENVICIVCGCSKPPFVRPARNEVARCWRGLRPGFVNGEALALLRLGQCTERSSSPVKPVFDC